MYHSGKIVGLILAAGYSSRMGVLKPLLPLGEKTIIETAVDSLRQGGIRDIRIVVGYRADELDPILKRIQVRVIENKRYAEGMFSSIITGLETMIGEAEAIFLLPVDNPLIRRHSIREMVKVYRKTGKAVIYPVFNGKKGHPPLISATCFEKIFCSDEVGGLRNVLARFATDSAEVELVDQGVLLDIDTVEDYEELVKYYARRKIPTYSECIAMLNKYQINQKVLRHGKAVANVGRNLTLLLNKVGLNLDLDLVVAGGLLHDLAKGKPNHPQIGEQLIARMEFIELSGIVARHMDMKFDADTEIDEGAVVFLADKLIQGDRRVSLVERFNPVLNKYYENPVIVGSIVRRMKTAEAIRDRVLNLLGISNLDELLLL